MAEHKVSGTDVLLMLSTDGVTYDTVVCLTQQGITRATTEIDAASKCGPDTLPGKQTNAVSFEGQLVADPNTGSTSIADLFNYWTNKTTVYWKMGKVSPVTGDVTYSGTGFISKLDETFGLDNPSTFSGSIGIYGLAAMAVEP
jgi:hypothetical protein